MSLAGLTALVRTFHPAAIITYFHRTLRSNPPASGSSKRGPAWTFSLSSKDRQQDFISIYKHWQSYFCYYFYYDGGKKNDHDECPSCPSCPATTMPLELAVVTPRR
jgi:hypothetical protein